MLEVRAACTNMAPALGHLGTTLEITRPDLYRRMRTRPARRPAAAAQSALRQRRYLLEEKAMSSARFYQGAHKTPVLQRLSFVAGIFILVVGCRDDVSPADHPTGVDTSPGGGHVSTRAVRSPNLLPMSAAPATTAASPFTFYQFVDVKFKMLPGETSGGAAALCPVGTQVVGGGVTLSAQATITFWIALSYPGYVPSTQQYGWQGVVGRPEGSPYTDSLVTRAVCAN
jgi:hypothetical protein